jgi:DNA-binding MarR family transcriptional regulator
LFAGALRLSLLHTARTDLCVSRGIVVPSKRATSVSRPRGEAAKAITMAGQKARKRTRKSDQPVGEKQMHPDYDSFGFLVRHAYRTFVKALAFELEPFGLSTGQWSALRILWDEEGMSQVELADLMRVEKASLTSILASMEHRGLITRLRSRDDGRKIYIYLTPKGKQLKRTVLPTGGKINARATATMSAGQQSRLRKSLMTLIANLET